MDPNMQPMNAPASPAPAPMAPGQQMPNPGQPAPQAPPQAPVNNKPRNPNSTQNTLLIAELREGMVIMNDGSFRAVVSCQSINFDLMSAKEREGVEYSYQSFLNSLYFPIQIFVRSQKVDIGPYMERLAKIRRDQDNMLLGVLMDDYMAFIDALSQETNIMDKDFYVVVPYYPTGDVASIANSSKGLFSGIFKPDQRKIVTIDQTTYTKAKEEIGNRVNAVMSGLYQLGIKSAQLSTKQLGELYYNVYNPDTAVREPM
ncbi:MAG TPA: hypothetical protein VF597_01565, partial [Candidatus Saccharimonadales bacterium]